MKTRIVVHENHYILIDNTYLDMHTCFLIFVCIYCLCFRKCMICSAKIVLKDRVFEDQFCLLHLHAKYARGSKKLSQSYMTRNIITDDPNFS